MALTLQSLLYSYIFWEFQLMKFKQKKKKKKKNIYKCLCCHFLPKQLHSPKSSHMEEPQQENLTVLELCINDCYGFFLLMCLHNQ